MEKRRIVVQFTGENVTQGMRYACWIVKATDTLRICDNYCFLIAKFVTRMCLNITFTRTLPLFTYLYLAYGTISCSL